MLAQYKQVAIVSVACLIIGGAAGYYMKPAKVVTVQVTQKNTDIVKRDNTVTTITQTKRPDGTAVTVTTITDKNTTDANSSTHTADKTTETRTEGATTVSALVGVDFGRGLAYGASVQHQILGPLNIGAFGLTNGVMGVSIGIRF